MRRLLIIATGLAVMVAMILVIVAVSLPRSVTAEEADSVAVGTRGGSPVGPTGWGSDMTEYRSRPAGRLIGPKQV